jgi:hypothetical protein
MESEAVSAMERGESDVWIFLPSISFRLQISAANRLRDVKGFHEGSQIMRNKTTLMAKLDENIAFSYV